MYQSRSKTNHASESPENGNLLDTETAFDLLTPPLSFRLTLHHCITADHSRHTLFYRRRLDTSGKCQGRFFVPGKVVAFGVWGRWWCVLMFWCVIAAVLLGGFSKSTRGEQIYFVRKSTSTNQREKTISSPRFYLPKKMELTILPSSPL